MAAKKAPRGDKRPGSHAGAGAARAPAPRGDKRSGSGPKRGPAPGGDKRGPAPGGDKRGPAPGGDKRGPAPGGDKRGGGSRSGPALRGAARRIFETTGEVPKPLTPAQKQRRALSNVGGATEVSGDPELAEVLRRALDVSSEESRTRGDVHGFHTYPARMHPDTATSLVQDLSPEGARVLDPFCGSGTVMSEARRAGRHAFGVDANPLATELAWLKTRGITNDESAELVDAAMGVREHADTRRKKKMGATQRYPDADVALFEPHVLLELDGLRDSIKSLEKGDIQRLLWLVFSSLIGKVSRRPGDTTSQAVPRRLGAGYTAKLFQRRTEELAQRLREYSFSLPRDAPVAKIRTGDARDLGYVRAGGMDLIVTSPPYAGVYDYYEHHAARLRWLGIPASQFEATELGSRRRLEALPFAQALGRYQQDFALVISEMARVLTPKGFIAFQVADSTLSGRAVQADRLVEQMATANGLSIVARASQKRTNYHGASQRAFADRPRAEHLLLLARH